MRDRDAQAIDTRDLSEWWEEDGFIGAEDYLRNQTGRAHDIARIAAAAYRTARSDVEKDAARGALQAAIRLFAGAVEALLKESD